jgi:lysozyme
MKKVVSLLMVSMSLVNTVGGYDVETSDFQEVESDNLRPLIEEFEGIKLVAYKCPGGVATIGIGSTRYEDGSKVKLGDEISLDYAEVLYERDVDRIRREVDGLVIPDLTRNQEDALVSFAYNVGINAFKSSTLLKKVNKDPRSNSIKREFMKWTTSDGKRLKGLVRRRKAEVELYFLKVNHIFSSNNS